jgi:hypothetical protein
MTNLGSIPKTNWPWLPLPNQPTPCAFLIQEGKKHALCRVLYFALTDHIFSWLERPGSEAVTSTISMMELLVHPYRELDPSRVEAFETVVLDQIL